MIRSDTQALRLLCYIVSIPVGVVLFKAFVFSIPYIGMLIFAFIFANFLMYWFSID